MTLIDKTAVFLKEIFDNSEYLKEYETDKNYRLEHSYRVANIAGEIAEKEGLDKEGLIIAGLLHDIAYCEEMKDEKDWLNHGRKSAKIARPFLEKLGLEPVRIQEICYGIAIHVDDEADFEGERTPFAISIGDADNIDRFDVYRIYEGLQYEGFKDLSLEEKKEKVSKKLEHLDKLMNIEIGTKAAKDMWLSRLNFQKEYYLKLQNQIENSTGVRV